MRPENSWEVVFDENGDGASQHIQDRELVWISEKDGKEVRKHYDPDAGLGRWMSVLFFSFFPLDDQL